MTIATACERNDVAPARWVGSVHVSARRTEEAVEDIQNALATGATLRVAFANTHLAYNALRDIDLRRSLEDFYVMNDGIGLSLLSWIACGRGFPENLNGTDFTPRLLNAVPAGTRIYLVGAKPGVVEAAAERMAETYPHVVLCGAHDGYSARGADKDDVFDHIRDQGAQLVLVAMGNPLQEAWIEEAAREIPGVVFLGVGALFDFIAGVQERAPSVLRKLRLEWLFRLSREPGRMAQRYTLEIAVLVVHCLAARLSQKAAR